MPGSRQRVSPACSRSTASLTDCKGEFNDAPSLSSLPSGETYQLHFEGPLFLSKRACDSGCELLAAGTLAAQMENISALVAALEQQIFTRVNAILCDSVDWQVGRVRVLDTSSTLLEWVAVYNTGNA